MNHPFSTQATVSTSKSSGELGARIERPERGYYEDMERMSLVAKLDMLRSTLEAEKSTLQKLRAAHERRTAQEGGGTGGAAARS